MLPAGRRSEAFFVPLMTWCNTGTFGDAKDSPLTANFAHVLSMEGSQVPNCERRAFTDERNIQIDVDVNASAGCGLGLGFSNKMKHSEVTYNRCRLQHLVK